MPNLQLPALRACIDALWERSILPQLQAFIRIPNESAAFDRDWEAHGHMERAVQLIVEWCRAQSIPAATTRVQRLAGRSPLIVVEVAGELPGTVLLYGHLDKQPPFTGWLEGLGPWQPVVRDGRLYGRGGADDGYAAFSSLAAIGTLKEQGVALPRCVLLIEASEESGSVDLPAHLAALGEALGSPALVVCLDAECGNYEQLWCTTSLRGNLTGRLRVRTLSEAVHSGMATGIAPGVFLIVDQLLARLEDLDQGTLRLPELQAPIPADRRAQISAAARVLGARVAGKIPLLRGVRPLSDDPEQLLINSTWRATLAVTGADGLPPTAAAGNVMLPEVALKLSLRLPPTCDAARAAAAVQAALTRDPPHGAEVTFEADLPSGGWNAPPFAPWLERALQDASRRIFGRDAVHVGSGGTIPFMGMLGQRFPQTQFLVTGVLGPQSNAHGPNEFLHLDYARQLTACVALVLAAHAAELAGSPAP
ncbi:MAG TPA: M20/M25/M40 family metallo-hydrolase [Steroidobacteraceae bacterium]|nr:M20/M25/M40 family metallo-hydrolase [Steroidobacteraceae bacterium]